MDTIFASSPFHPYLSPTVSPLWLVPVFFVAIIYATFRRAKKPPPQKVWTFVVFFSSMIDSKLHLLFHIQFDHTNYLNQNFGSFPETPLPRLSGAFQEVEVMLDAAIGLGLGEEAHKRTQVDITHDQLWREAVCNVSRQIFFFSFCLWYHARPSFMETTFVGWVHSFLSF